MRGTLAATGPVADPKAARAPTRRPARTPGGMPVPVSFVSLVRGVALLASLDGCAARPVAAPPAPRPAPPAATAPAARPAENPPSGTQVGTTASGGSITIRQAPAPVTSVVDSTPSEEALAVLRTIPEPLGATDPPDTVRVPVPEPTQPLGDRPGRRPISAPPESLAAPIVPPQDATAAATVPADSCWRVQILAPPERERADRMAGAARSQLLLPFVIEHEGGLFKVRVRDCLSAAAANDVRRRAVQSGFEGAFRFHAKPR